MAVQPGEYLLHHHQHDHHNHKHYHLAINVVVILSYYLPDYPPNPDQSILLYLEGGGGCFDAASCVERCTVASPLLCTQDPALVKNFTGSIWSEVEEENPGLHDFYKVYVPYCTSDVYAGTRDAVEDSAGYAFHGKYVVKAVVDQLLKIEIFQTRIPQFVLMGMSAGKASLSFTSSVLQCGPHDD